MFGFGKKNEKLTFAIEGMTCQGCVNGVERAISSVSGVKEVVVDLEKKEALVTGEKIEINSLVKAVEVKGFKAIQKN